MKIVRLLIYADAYKKVLRQTDNSEGIWNDIKFTLDDIDNADYVVTFNRYPDSVKLTCIPENIWLVNMEPAVEEYEWLRKAYKNYSLIFDTDEKINHKKVVHSPIGIPWFVEKSYNELKTISHIDKSKNISCISSDYIGRKGPKNRVKFIERIQGKLEFDMFGRGYNPIIDKWDGLAPYKYSIAIENHSSKYYWTEKIADCFLSLTMPIYYGCDNIEDYFPKESYIQIDIDKPKEAVKIIKNAVKMNYYEKNLEAIKYSKELVLEKYQIFPLILEWIEKYGTDGKKKLIEIKSLTNLYPHERKKYNLHRVYYLIKKAFYKNRYIDPDSKYFGQVTY